MNSKKPENTFTRHPFCETCPRESGERESSLSNGFADSALFCHSGKSRYPGFLNSPKFPDSLFPWAHNFLRNNQPPMNNKGTPKFMPAYRFSIAGLLVLLATFSPREDEIISLRESSQAWILAPARSSFSSIT
jgi:hypothetical protein